jgi:hypothetical protein
MKGGYNSSTIDMSALDKLVSQDDDDDYDDFPDNEDDDKDENDDEDEDEEYSMLTRDALHQSLDKDLISKNDMSKSEWAAILRTYIRVPVTVLEK